MILKSLHIFIFLNNIRLFITSKQLVESSLNTHDHTETGIELESEIKKTGGNASKLDKGIGSGDYTSRSQKKDGRMSHHSQNHRFLKNNKNDLSKKKKGRLTVNSPKLIENNSIKIPYEKINADIPMIDEKEGLADDESVDRSEENGDYQETYAPTNNKKCTKYFEINDKSKTMDQSKPDEDIVYDNTNLEIVCGKDEANSNKILNPIMKNFKSKKAKMKCKDQSSKKKHHIPLKHINNSSYDWSPRVRKVVVPGKPRKICIIKVIPIPVDKEGRPWKNKTCKNETKILDDEKQDIEKIKSLEDFQENEEDEEDDINPETIPYINV